jgi:hypothetical protein
MLRTPEFAEEGRSRAALDSSSEESDGEGDLLTADQIALIRDGEARSGTSGLRQRKLVFEDDNDAAFSDDEAKVETQGGSWWSKRPQLSSFEVLWTWIYVHTFGVCSLDPLVDWVYKMVRSAEERAGTEVDYAKRIRDAGSWAKKNFALIGAAGGVLLGVAVLYNYVMFADSAWVAHAKPWDDDYSSLHSFKDVAAAFDHGRVLTIFETEAGVVSGTFPSVAAPVFVHNSDPRMRETIDSLKGRLEKFADGLCRSDYQPSVVCPPMFGLAVSMITVCNGGSPTHMYNPSMTEKEGFIGVVAQLDTFLSFDHSLVAKRGTMKGVSIGLRHPAITVRHSSWDGVEDTPFTDDASIGIQICLDLLQGEWGTLMDDVPVERFMGVTRAPDESS